VGRWLSRNFPPVSVESPRWSCSSDLKVRHITEENKPDPNRSSEFINEVKESLLLAQFLRLIVDRTIVSYNYAVSTWSKE
jgi:hypothetical protein